MTAPNSRDSALAAEIVRGFEAKLRVWADTLPRSAADDFMATITWATAALARGPQQADSLVNPADSLVTQAGKDELLGRLDLMADHGWRAPREAAVRIRALQAEVARLRERTLEMERQRDDYLNREWVATKAKQAAEAALREESARLDWLEATMRHYGDGYTEPREASIGWIGWQQSKEQPSFPGLRATIDAALNGGQN